MRNVKKVVFPSQAELSFTWKVLISSIPMEGNPIGSWRYSERGAPNYRIAAVTKQTNWTVDCYHGYYFCVKVGSRAPDICQDHRSLVNLLCRMLRTPPRTK
jgi:hypothetical protein